MPDKRHRILFVQKPTGGGSMLSLYELVRGLDSERYEPFVLFHHLTSYHDKIRATGAHVMTLQQGQQRQMRTSARAIQQLRTILRDDWRLARRTALLIKAHNIDLIHHNNSLSGNRDTILGGYLAKIPQVLHVRMSHNQHSFVDRLVMRLVDRTIYISKAMQEAHAQQNIMTARGLVIYNPIDVEAFKMTQTTQQLRDVLGLTKTDQIIANIGRIDTWKGQDDFIRAIARVATQHPNIKALIVGEVNSKPLSQAYYRELQELVLTLKLTDRVIFTGHRDDIPDIMRMSDIIVHSASKPEPFGRVIAEGMAAGRPVIATAAGGVFEIIEDKVTGFLVPPKEPVAMANAISYFFQHPIEAQQMAERAQKYVQSAFPVEHHIKQVQEVYTQLLSRKVK
jgi:glycosyltransferase involved in cell wall biosynthesis